MTIACEQPLRSIKNLHHGWVGTVLFGSGFRDAAQSSISYGAREQGKGILMHVDIQVLYLFDTVPRSLAKFLARAICP